MRKTTPRLLGALALGALALGCGDGSGDPPAGGPQDPGPDTCGGGDFDLTWTGGLDGGATGDCVVAVTTQGAGTIPGEFSISAIEERAGEDNVGLLIRINRETLAPIQAVLTPEPGGEIGCNESDVFMMGNFDGTVEFTRREADGFELSVDINLSCSDDAETDPRPDFDLRLTGTIAGTRDLTDA